MQTIRPAVAQHVALAESVAARGVQHVFTSGCGHRRWAVVG